MIQDFPHLLSAPWLYRELHTGLHETQKKSSLERKEWRAALVLVLLSHGLHFSFPYIETQTAK